jgi:predicted ATPase/DNA-binding SARP family transcriptional activator
MSRKLQIRALGGLSIQCNEKPVEGFDQRKVQALLVYLACTGRAHPREILAEMFWEERTQSQALANLRTALTSLRKTVGPFVTITREMAGTDPASHVWLDATEFEAQIDAAGSDIARLSNAVELYQGDFLAGFYVDSHAFEEWATRERERLRLRMMDALDTLITCHMEGSDTQAGIARANQLLTMDLLREETHRQIIDLLWRSGQRGAALEQYDTCCRLLADELGIEPTPETTALYDKIRAGEVAYEHPQIRVTAPQARASPGPAQPRPRHNLPPQPTSFIGRKQEITQIIDRLTDPTCRLLTLTGTGGVGKTRLALEVATRLMDEFPDGVWFVGLATNLDSELVADTVGRALGMTEVSGQTIGDTLKRYLADKELLLLLDNFEHVIDAAPLVSELVTAAPRLTILVTSREVLRLYGEQPYDVPPLSVPDTDYQAPLALLIEYEALAMFEQCARSVRQDFALTETNAPVVAEICARLDGLPLAIELAAARTRLFSPDALLNRLDERLKLLTGGARDRPARLQTLRNTIDWSYDLLSEDEQTLFARLSVFQDGRTVEAAEAVCGYDLGLNVLDGLESLLDKSLIQQERGPEGEPRLVYLETIHDYARERLDERGETDEMRRRHADFFLAMMERILPELSGPIRPAHLMNRLEAEHGNIRAVLAWALAHRDERILPVLAGRDSTLHAFWSTRTHFTEGRQWINQALDQFPDAPPSIRCKMLNTSGRMAAKSGDCVYAETAHQEALILAQETDDTLLIGDSLFGLAACFSSDDPDQAKEHYEEVLELTRCTAHTRLCVSALNNLGEIARYQGNWDEARTFYEESIAAMHSPSNDFHSTPTGLAFVALFQHDYERAHDIFTRNLRLSCDLGNRVWCISNLIGLAGVHARTGNSGHAARFFGTIDAILDSVVGFDLQTETADKAEYDRYLALTREQLDAATFDALYAEGRAMSLDDAVAYALEEEP